MPHFNILTIFPRIFDSYINESILKIAQAKGKIEIKTHNIRDFASDKHHTVDDKPYGGGPGMLMMAGPIYKCLKSIKRTGRKGKSKVILFSPAGKVFDQEMAKKFSKMDQLIFICGRYEGIDARVEKFIDEKISTGPYVLSGGEIPALAVIEAVSRLVPGVLGKEKSLEDETFKSDGYMEYPQYTRPEVWTVEKKKLRVPKVLLSGHHEEIRKWREGKAKQ